MRVYWMLENNKLSDCEWDVRYSSASHDLINDFFVPALERSRFYYRIAGFFSSTSIAAASRGISAFIENGEKMYLVVGGQLSEEDVNAINNGIENIDSVLHKKWENCKSDFNNAIIKNRFEMLAWLIANGKLEIKIGINKGKDGRYLPSELSMFHEKVLIFEDHDGNMIQLDGSINETWKAWKENRESFCVHKSWVNDEKKFINTAKEDFDTIWNNFDHTSEVMDLPEAIKKDLISIRPKNLPSPHDEMDFSSNPVSPAIIDKKALRNYQEEAIDAWIEKKYIGILEMATGTGKTFTALNAIKRLDMRSKILVIAVPQKELANQWADECEALFDDTKTRVVPCHSDTGWKKEISREIRQSMKESGLCILIPVLNTLRTEAFFKHIKKVLSEVYLVMDEVHETGSYQNRMMFPKLSDVKYRLGLSATPERMWDDEGNASIKAFFGDEPIFVWDMEKAINPPEGYDACLCEYKYYLHDCSLNKEELDYYEELSLKIKKALGMKSNGACIDIKDIDDKSSLTILLNKRANIIKECESKLSLLEDILDNYSGSLKKCIVYCNDKKHMDKVTSIILSKGFNCLKFYGDLDPDQRGKVFEEFEEHSVQFLVAIKCLDQGIDIPVCNSAIILTSSRNPREYIQRRGRVLRLHKNKEFAIIHDVLVFPYPLNDLEMGRKKLADFEIKIIENQLDRVEIFMKNSMNSGENLLRKIEYGNVLINAREDT